MLKQVKQFMVVVLLAVSVMSFSGCFWLLFGAAAGAGGYAWINGEMEKEFAVPAQKLTDATVKAIKSLDLTILEKDADRISALIRSETVDGSKIKATITAITERSSKIKLRVGLLGDKAKSEMIMNAIMGYL